MTDSKQQHIFMLGSDPEGRGGISAVVQSYVNCGFLRKHQICYLITHIDGTKLQKLLVAIRAWLNLITALIHHKVAAVHLHPASDISFWRKSIFIITAALFKVPILTHIHGGDFQQFYEIDCGVIKKSFIRWILNTSSLVIVLSPHWQSWFQQLIPAHKLKVLPNPVEMMPLLTNAAESESPQLLFMGTLEPRKGVLELFEAFQQLIPDYPNLKLVYGGSGELEQQLAEKIRATSLEKQVLMPGWVRGCEKTSLLQQSTIFVLPSYNENFPVSLLEAMSATLPVIVTNVGGVVDIIEDGENGLLIATGDVAGIASKVRQLLDNPALRNSIGQKGRQYVEQHCSQERVMLMLEAIYRDLNLLDASSKP